MHASSLLLALVFLVPAVRGCDPGGSSGSSGSGGSTDPDPVTVLDPIETDCPVSATDAVTVDYASVDGDQLTVGISYAGGCEDHDLALCWDGGWIKTSPMKVDLALHHDAHGDECKALVLEERTFDLSGVHDDTEAGFPGQSGVWVLLGDESLWYAF